MLGFSPNVPIFPNYSWLGKEPDYDAVVYKYKNKGEMPVYLFEDWDGKEKVERLLDTIKKCLDLQLNLFAVPEFFVDIGEDGKKINITIRDPKAVTTKYLRDLISRIYTCYRERIVKERASWGEKSGIKAKIQDRNKKMRELYRNLRDENSNVAAENHQSKLLEEIRSVYGKLGDISLETVQRILYQKE